MASLSLGCAQLSAAFNPATCLHRSRAFAHAPVHPTSAAVPAHRRARVVAWTTSWRARNLTATRAVAEPRGSSANKEDDWDEDEDEVEDDEGFDDDHDGPALGGDRFVKMTHTELLVMTPEQRKEYHKRSVLEGQIRAKKKRERQKHESISGEVFRPRERIKSQRDFQRVMNQQGNNFNGKLMRIKYCSNEGLKDVDCTRIGIKVPKKFVKRAVDRNLVKRRIREIFRRNKDAWPARTDLIVMCNETTLKAKYEDVRREFLYWGTEYVPRMASKKQGDRGVRGGSKGERGKKAAPPREDTDRAA